MYWNVGFFQLRPGARMRVELTWPGTNGYPGLQFMMASPWTATTLQAYEVTTEERGLVFQLVRVQQPDWLAKIYGPRYKSVWTYVILVRNASPDTLWFSVTGSRVG